MEKINTSTLGVQLNRLLNKLKVVHLVYTLFGAYVFHFVACINRLYYKHIIRTIKIPNTPVGKPISAHNNLKHDRHTQCKTCLTELRQHTTGLITAGHRTKSSQAWQKSANFSSNANVFFNLFSKMSEHFSVVIISPAQTTLQGTHRYGYAHLSQEHEMPKKYTKVYLDQEQFVLLPPNWGEKEMLQLHVCTYTVEPLLKDTSERVTPL